jgi:hypothetical protein
MNSPGWVLPLTADKAGNPQYEQKTIKLFSVKLKNFFFISANYLENGCSSAEEAP